MGDETVFPIIHHQGTEMLLRKGHALRNECVNGETQKRDLASNSLRNILLGSHPARASNSSRQFLIP